MIDLGLFGTMFSSTSGPGKLCRNLVKGLDQLGVQYHINHPKKEQVYGRVNGCICGFCGVDFFQLDSNTVLGPCIWNVPSDDLRNNYALVRKFKRYLCASPWHANLFRTWPQSAKMMEDRDIRTWACGVDTHDIQDMRLKPKTVDCLLYTKKESKRHTEVVKTIGLLGLYQQTYRHVSYDKKYTPEEFKAAMSDCKYGIVIVGSETQGLAVMEMMASNLPLLVVDYPHWNLNAEWEATSIPYWSECCGQVVKTLDSQIMTRFLNHYNQYRPRDYIVEHFTLKRAAQQYMDCLV